jgi:uncharacterized membrane protein
MDGGSSDWVLFLGRFHPLILHVPIGFLTLAFVLEVLSRFNRFRHFQPTVGFVLLLGAVSAFLACVFGLMLAQSGGYQEKILSIHQWSGIAVCVLSVMAYALRQLPAANFRFRDKTYIATMSVMFVTIAVAGHYGGSLTHGSDYLTKHMPSGLRALAGIPEEEKFEKKIITNLDSAVVYADIIDPILRNTCTSCHSESKSKGDLMMHNEVVMLKGGESGELFIPGNAAGSLLMERILLPEDHEDHMPPEGKKQLTEKEVELLAWWINEGAAFDKLVSQVNVPADVQSILDELVTPGANMSEVEILLASESNPVSEQELVSLQQKGLSISTLSSEVHWLQADISPDAAADSILATFDKVSDNITWLNLAGTKTTDAGLSQLAKLKHLTRLHLDNTAITDKGLQHLKNLQYLESLNLYGTKVSDEGIQQLAGLKNLRKLYLWKTNVTPEGSARLKDALPDLDVNLGLEVSSN